MIIEEEKKVEIIDEAQATNLDFNQVSEGHKSKIIKRSFIVAGIILIFILITILIFLGIFTIYNKKHSYTIINGVSINGIDMSNFNKEEAENALKDYYREKFSSDIALVHNDYVTYIKPQELEVDIDIESAINSAFSIGKSANIFLDDLQAIKTMLFKTNITPKITFNENILKNMLNDLSPSLPDAITQSGYYIDGNELIITGGQEGFIIDVDSSSEIIKEKILSLNYSDSPIELMTIAKSPDKIDIDMIYNQIHKEPKDAYFEADTRTVHPSENGVDFAISTDEAKNLLQNLDKEISIPLKVLQPNVTTNELGQEAFPELLSEFSTKYKTSEKDRTTNLKLAASKINNYVLLPGETFSYNNVVRRKNNSSRI